MFGGVWNGCDDVMYDNVGERAFVWSRGLLRH